MALLYLPPSALRRAASLAASSTRESSSEVVDSGAEGGDRCLIRGNTCLDAIASVQRGRRTVDDAVYPLFVAIIGSLVLLVAIAGRDIEQSTGAGSFSEDHNGAE